ncbi:hypothetical protein ACMFMG_011643 [Clarireedia jacksonii]
MAARLRPKTNTYHCTFCTSLLLATTYQLSSLPTRQSSLDHSIILPLSSTIPLSSRFQSPSPSPSPTSPPAPPTAEPSSSTEPTNDPMQGLEQIPQPESPAATPAPLYTSFTSPNPTISAKPVIIRRQGEDGFEKRSLYRCARCAVVIGYEIVSESEGVGKAKEEEDERVFYILPGALMSTDVMASEKKVVREEEVEGVLRGEGVAVYE